MQQRNIRIKRMLDFIPAMLAIFILVIPIFLISVLTKISSPGPILHWSKRVRKQNKIFYIPKFRSMKINTPGIVTHLMDNPSFYVTSFGIFLRKLSLDELPQLWSILIGDMSFVGSRPALHNQDDLIQLRVKYNLQLLRPGLAGWAQVNWRDELSLNEKVKLDKYYANNQSLWLDLKISVMILMQIRNIKNVKH